MTVKNNITFANFTFSMLNNVPKLLLTYNTQISKPEFTLQQKLNVFALSNARYMLEKERKVCFPGNVKYRLVDRTVWNHNTMPLPITRDPLECNDLIRHLNGTDNKILNNFN